MTKKHSTKRALIASVLMLALCFTALVGTTFAWFTDSATSSGNKIISGSLKVDLEILDKEDGWTSIKESSDPIFNYDKWEPGYVDVKLLKVENEGTLALKWKAKFVSAEELSALANVIDVYVNAYGVVADAQADSITYPDTRTLDGYTYAGTVADFVNEIETATTGELLAGESAYLGIALKMREDAGNEYQDMSLGGAFDIQILATQLAAEEDSFDDQYDADAKYITSAATLDAFFTALENGDDVLLTEQLAVNAVFINYMNERYPVSTLALGDETEVVDTDAFIDGGGITVYRTEALAAKPIFSVEEGYTLTLANITLDGGAKWTGETDPVLLRGTTNSGMTTSGTIITTVKNAHIVLEEGAILQNNDGANAVNLNTRAGSTLTLNGGEIINNHSAAGAIWGGGAITVNSGKINGNHGGIGGAIRVVTNVGTVLTMNGGEMNHNKSDDVGGAIWAGSSSSSNVYVLNGGEMAYNYSPSAGGAMYAGYYETVKIGGTFKMHDNSAPAAGAIRFHNHASFEMTGGEIYDNGDNSLFLLNNTAKITGGTISDNFSYGGGLGFTLGEANIEGVVSFDLSTNHNTAYLAENFSTLTFTVNEADEHFANFNFKPAAEYTYTEGDEAKLVCQNEGYSTYWDATTGTFRLKAD